MAPPFASCERKEFNTEDTGSTENYREMHRSHLLESPALWANQSGCDLR